MLVKSRRSKEDTVKPVWFGGKPHGGGVGQGMRMTGIVSMNTSMSRASVVFEIT